MLKNTASQAFHVIAFNSSGRVSGDAANITCQLAKDGGSRVATNDVNPTEIGTTGEYVFTLTQAESNGHELSFTPESGTPGVQVLGVPSNVIYTTRDLVVSGSYTLPVTVLGAGSPIEGATVTVTRTGKSETKVTNASGVAAFTLDAATWTISVTADGFAGDASAVDPSTVSSVGFNLKVSAASSPATETPLTLTVIRGDDYTDGSPNGSLAITGLRFALDVTGGKTYAFKLTMMRTDLRESHEFTGDVVPAANESLERVDDDTVIWRLTAAESALISSAGYKFDLQATREDGSVGTARYGDVVVKETYTDP